MYVFVCVYVCMYVLSTGFSSHKDLFSIAVRILVSFVFMGLKAADGLRDSSNTRSVFWFASREGKATRHQTERSLN